MSTSRVFYGAVFALGQDFSRPVTGPPCASGYVPVIDRGVSKCIPGTAGSSMIGPASAGGAVTRTFPVKAWRSSQ